MIEFQCKSRVVARGGRRGTDYAPHSTASPPRIQKPIYTSEISNFFAIYRISKRRSFVPQIRPENEMALRL